MVLKRFPFQYSFECLTFQEDDFYASDEDEFLDRTGTLETKRKKRMKMLNVAVEEKSETFESLCQMSKDLSSQVEALKLRLDKAQEALKTQAESDDLDTYMNTLSESADAGSKETLAKLKSQLAALLKEQQRVNKLVEVTRPTKMPELKPTSISLTTFILLNFCW